MGGKASKTTTSEPDVPKNWNTTHIPSQKDKIAIVTGGNSGIGFIAALELARNGAHVVLACRNRERGLKAEADIRELIRSVPGHGTVKLVIVDIGDLSSVHKFCETFKKMHPRLDLLVNNAGVVGGTYTKTVDGYELQFATNYLGHFALTAQLFDQLNKSESSRVVTVSSLLHRHAYFFFNEDKIMANNEEEYGQITTYCVSKLCNLLFTLELDRRLKAAGINNITTAAAHPGYCDTKIMKKGADTNRDSWLWWLVFRTVAVAPPQSAEKGALPILYAATADGVKGGDYFGPKYLECYGSPIREDPSTLSKSEPAAVKLWAFSEKLTHLTFEVVK
ncbi:short chain dehydrogenase [Phytophthora infestans]|uniref:Short chain dehydrogenase n=1 Tax=Phytophthora infestans TaxID=4787 RepID=A0A833TKW7_PHYIN|nr:short chain dehydrogenase [Phytophthora infestans]KAF4148289.1 short chain dehydrogenase [Phytophthora infestans]